jgi:hypothetical protein
MDDSKHGAAHEPSSPTQPLPRSDRQPATGFLILVGILIALLLGCAAIITYQFGKILDLEQHIDRLQEDQKQARPPQPPQGQQ